RRLIGQFYTPPHVVQYCLDVGLSKDSSKFINAIKRSKGQEKLPRILDPSCGTGNFLIGCIYWIDKLLPGGLSGDDRLSLIAGLLGGIDLDARAVSLARMTLMLLAGQSHHLSDSDATALLKTLRRNICVSDSLILKALDEDNKYDLVVTNPPYVSFGARNQ